MAARHRHRDRRAAGAGRDGTRVVVVHAVRVALRAGPRRRDDARAVRLRERERHAGRRDHAHRAALPRCRRHHVASRARGPGPAALVVAGAPAARAQGAHRRHRVEHRPVEIPAAIGQFLVATTADAGTGRRATGPDHRQPERQAGLRCRQPRDRRTVEPQQARGPWPSRAAIPAAARPASTGRRTARATPATSPRNPTARRRGWMPR